ncbi:hypothetical protein MBANPS3_007680 [Mucor bainieri]
MFQWYLCYKERLSVNLIPNANIVILIDRGLKTVINGQLDYAEFLSRLAALQVSSHQAMAGLSQCLSILQQAIFNGSFYNSTSTLDLQLLDLDKRGIFQGVDSIEFCERLWETSIQKSTLTSKYRQWGSGIGNKRCSCHFTLRRVMDLITEQLPQDMRVDFKTGYTLQASCRQFFTNFSNMWSQSKCRADLRVVLDLLLRMHLAQDRFFGPKKQHKKEVTADKTKTPRVHLKTHMDTLFWSIQQGKRADVINHWSEVLFERSKKRLPTSSRHWRLIDVTLLVFLEDMRRNTNLWIQLFMAVSKKSVVIATSCAYGNKSSKV